MDDDAEALEDAGRESGGGVAVRRWCCYLVTEAIEVSVSCLFGNEWCGEIREKWRGRGRQRGVDADATSTELPLRQRR